MKTKLTPAQLRAMGKRIDRVGHDVALLLREINRELRTGDATPLIKLVARAQARIGDKLQTF